MTTTRGQVKWFDPKKGYGFIVGPIGQDVFVHYSQIQGDGFRSLKDGEPVEYELIEGEKGWQARTVTRINPPMPRIAVNVNMPRRSDMIGQMANGGQF